MLERQRIRTDAKARIVAAATDAETVTTSRATPFAVDELPAINIYTPNENGNGLPGATQPEFVTVCTLGIDVVVAASDGYEDALDALCEAAIDDALLRNADFVKEFERVTTLESETGFVDGGEVTMAVATYRIGLQYTAVFPPTVSDDLALTDIQVDAVDPADPNTGNEGEPGGYEGGEPGPDGRIEGHASVEHETE